MSKSKATWKLKDGTVVRIKDMTDGHLGNSLRMMSRWLAEGRLAGSREKAFEEMQMEAAGRFLIWECPPGLGCSFDVDEELCNEQAVMWTEPTRPPNDDRGQEPRCQIHRPDAHKYYEIPCDGCFEKRELIFGIGRDEGRLLFCSSCATPDSWLAQVLSLIFFIITFGMVRKEPVPYEYS